MKLAEFKAWFEGFTENVGGAPTEAQWGRIKEQVGKIDGTATSYPVFVDRYLPRYPSQIPYWQTPYWASIQAQGVGMNATSYASNQTKMKSASLGMGVANEVDEGTRIWDPQKAFRDLGRAEAQGVA